MHQSNTYIDTDRGKITHVILRPDSSCSNFINEIILRSLSAKNIKEIFMFREFILYINLHLFTKLCNKSAGFYCASVMRYFNEGTDQLYFK